MYFTGFDLGQAVDFTAMATGQQLPAELPTKHRRWQYLVRYLRTWDLGTEYTKIAGDTAEIFARPPLPYSWLAVDFTGVGRPVVDQLRAQKVTAKICPILITAGHAATQVEDSWEFHVPKRELVGNAIALFQSNLVKIAVKGKEADRLRKELSLFTSKLSRKSANEQFGTWADGQHDDLVLALMMMLWLGEKMGGAKVEGISVEPKAHSAISTAPKGVFPERQRDTDQREPESWDFLDS